MPFGSLPTSGGGLRCWQIYQGLKSRGVDVVASMPSFTFLTKKYFDQIPEDVRENLWEWHTQDEIYNRVKPDAVIYSSNWDHYNLTFKPNVPLIIDLHGSRLIETSLWGETPDITKKLNVFSKADCLLTAGQKQKMYFYGWLLQAGRIPQDEHFIRYIPISLAPETFKRIETPADEKPLFVSGGGWFPWQDQSNAIFKICSEIDSRDNGVLKIFGTPHENKSPSADELKIISIFQKVKALADNNERIQVKGYVGRDELLTEYSKANVAVELMRYNLERELAFTTRTIEYLWCGLPVLYNHYSEISDHIRDYDAGWTVDPESPDDLKMALDEIFGSEEIVRKKSENAQKLVRERFSWDKTIEPLMNFLEKPEVLKVSKPATSFNFNSSPYLSPQGNEVVLELDQNHPVKQTFVYPAEGIWALQLCLDKVSGDVGRGSVACKVKNCLGITIGKWESDLKNIKPNSYVFVTLNKILRPSGGSKGIFELELKNVDSSCKIFIKALAEAKYPLDENLNISKLIALDSLGRRQSAKALALHFTPGVGRLYKLKTQVKKAIWILKQGEIKRIFRAVLRRSPGLKPILKHFI